MNGRRRRLPPRRRLKTYEKGYDLRHTRLRRKIKPLVDSGTVRCWRCQQLIVPGTAWHLGHDDHPRAKQAGWYRGPEHAACSWASGGWKRQGLRPPPARPRSRAKALSIFDTEPVAPQSDSDDDDDE